MPTSHGQYIVAATPRTGSYLLCEGLESTGIAGRPTEVFCPKFQGIWRRRWSLDDSESSFAEYLQSALNHGTTLNGVYGLKIHWMHVQALARQANFIGRFDNILEYLFPGAKYVHIVRRDIRAQAISYYRALATEEWWKIPGIENYQMNGRVAVFDADSIVALEKELLEQQRSWEHYFEMHSITPLLIEYEALAASYQSEIAKVLRFLDLDDSVAAQLPVPRLARQSDETTSQWCRDLSLHERTG
jgi:LPS sulfotransferase NodH